MAENADDDDCERLGSIGWVAMSEYLVAAGGTDVCESGGYGERYACMSEYEWARCTRAGCLGREDRQLAAHRLRSTRTCAAFPTLA